MQPRRLLSNISTMRQASTQVPRVPPQAQRVGECHGDLTQALQRWVCIGLGCPRGEWDGVIARRGGWVVMGLEQCR